MDVSRLSASLVSGVNETTLALANFNLDFSLFKVAAPPEFAPLGHALTPQRRRLAEQGSAHRTARRLGALFEEIAPAAPGLIRAYGRRASAISALVGMQGTDQPHQHPGKGGGKPAAAVGVFAECAGIDATSVWAAATSGQAALSVHLLACMLARAWSSPQAISIWVELVAERRRILTDRIERGLFTSAAQLGLAASEALSRADLAAWDASARAWLQIADEAMLKRQKQLMLIVNNVNIPVNQGEGGRGGEGADGDGTSSSTVSTYTRVIEAWTTAMVAMERVVGGQSQRVSKGSVLLALASWHVYPDLVVVGEKVSNVKFAEDVVEQGAQLVIGLEDPNADRDEGVYWSLSLAHLNYYGDPVKVTSFTARDASRLSIDEFHLLVFGAVLADWTDEQGADLPAEGAQFFIALEACLSRVGKGHHPHQLDAAAVTHPQILGKNGWVSLLAETARGLSNLKDGPDKSSAHNVVALGQRRGHNLLAERGHRAPPMLGLCHPWVMSLLQLPTLEARGQRQQQVHLMRYIASQLGLRADQCIIRARGGHRWTYWTAMPHHDCQPTGGDGQAGRHVRWLEFQGNGSKSPASALARFRCICHKTEHSCHAGRCPCLRNGRTCTAKCHDENVPAGAALPCPGCLRIGDDAGAVLSCANLIPGVSCKHVMAPFFTERSSNSHIVLQDWGVGASAVEVTKKLRDHTIKAPPKPPFAIELSPEATLCSCFAFSHVAPTFSLIAGQADDVGLFLRSDIDVLAERPRLHRAVARAAQTPLLSVAQVCRMLAEEITPKALLSYLESLYGGQAILIPRFIRSLPVRSYDVTAYLRSLHAVTRATQVYTSLPGATISLALIGRPLHAAAWIPDNWMRALTRQEKLACIAMLESGTYNVAPRDLDEVLAISARNNIFVSCALLRDPALSPTPSSLSFSTSSSQQQQQQQQHSDDIVRVVGNVGRSGTVLMVAPQAPRMRTAALEDWRAITHAPFDGSLEDSFSATSLHLRFTEFELPFNVGARGAIDKDLLLVETLVQCYDRGKWVADLDVLRLFAPGNDLVRTSGVTCQGCGRGGGEKKKQSLPRQLRSFDSWEELFDPPEKLGTRSVGVVRARGNWLARLAAACICTQRGLRVVLVPPQPPPPSDEEQKTQRSQVCWACNCRKQWLWKRETLVRTTKAAEAVAKRRGPGGAEGEGEENQDAESDEEREGWDEEGEGAESDDEAEVVSVIADDDEDDDDVVVGNRHLPQVFIV